MRVILVTGGCGFIGSHFVERLIAGGFQVVNVDALTYAGDESNVRGVADHPAYAFYCAKIQDRETIARIFETHRPDMVFNLAAESHVDRSIDNATPFLETNVTGVHILLESSLAYWRALAAEQRQRFLFVQMSTDEVYGSIDEGVFTEDSNYAPNSPYAASKAAGDHLARSYRVTFGLPTAVAHASNTYGPRQYPEKLIPHMVSAALSGMPLPVYGEGAQVRDWMFVGDLARGLEQVIQGGESGGVYNFAGGEERRNIDTVKELCSVLDRLAPRGGPYAEAIRFVEDRPGHDMRYAMSNAKVERLFGWRPEVSFSAGFEATIRWYLDNSEWMARILEKGYVNRRIGQRA